MARQLNTTKVNIYTLYMSYLIVAFDELCGIGRDNRLPWHETEAGHADMKHFRRVTHGAAVIMGYRTFQSIGMPLKNRTNIVVTRSHGIELSCQFPDLHIFNSLDLAVRFGKKLESDGITKCFIIGGESIYREYLTWYYPTEIYVTIIPRSSVPYECDRFFPRQLLSHTRYNISSVTGEHGEVYTTYTYNPREESAYLDVFKQVLTHGHHKSDRTKTGTVSIFSPPNLEFSLRDGTIPILTTKQVAVKTCLTELLWFISGSTNTKELEKQGCNIWKGNTSKEFLESRGLSDYEEGDIGPGYGHQWRHAGASYEGMHADYTGKGVDQIANMIKLLQEDPDSRRIMMSAWSVPQLDEMALPPCHVLYQLYTHLGEDGRRYLSGKMYQRSGDSFLGVPFNILSYAALTHMIAHVTGMVADRLIFTYGDYHIYQNHTAQVLEQLTRVPRAFPKVRFSRKVDSIDDFKLEDIEILGYSPHPKISASMAV